jgi:hypothetical protein
MNVYAPWQRNAPALALRVIGLAVSVVVLKAGPHLAVAQWRSTLAVAGWAMTMVCVVSIARLRASVRRARAGKADAYAVGVLRTYGLALTPAQVEALFFPDRIPTARYVVYGTTRAAGPGHSNQLVRLVYTDRQLRLLDAAGVELPRSSDTAPAAR